MVLVGLAEPPTAILAVNDMVAIGAVMAIQEKEIQAPKEMSVIGF